MFTNNIKRLQSNFNDFSTSNFHSTTREIQQQIQLINNGLDNVKLDYEFHQLSKRFDTKSDQTNIEELVKKGNDLVQELNIRLHINEIKNKENNQIREVHTWALNSLNEYIQVLQPYASSSYARLDNMAHQLGVTDRFVGYRNNLTRYGNQPTHVHTIWADRKLPMSSTPNWKDWSYAFQHNNSKQQVPVQPTRTSYSSMATTHPIEIQRPKSKKSVSRSFNYSDDYNSQMIQAGRSIVYPGQSETMDRFKKSPPRSYTPSFAVAQADFTRIGRPLARLVSKSSCSEYIDRYTFPDSSKLERYPWLRP